MEKVHTLYGEVYNPMLGRFFDLESEELLDEKIEVLESLKAGKTIAEIPNFYNVLELYPKPEEGKKYAGIRLKTLSSA